MSLRNLLEAVWHSSPDRLNLSAYNTETLSILGSYTFSDKELKNIADQIKEQSPDGIPVLKPLQMRSEETEDDKKMMSLFKAQIFGSMNHLICGFDADVIEEVLREDDVAKTLLPIYGLMKSCPKKEALQAIAKAVRQIKHATVDI